MNKKQILLLGGSSILIFISGILFGKIVFNKEIKNMGYIDLIYSNNHSAPEFFLHLENSSDVKTIKNSDFVIFKTNVINIKNK